MTAYVLTPHQELAAELLRERFGTVDVRPHETWGSSVVVEAQTPDGGFFLKANGDRSVRAEAFVARTARDAGVPVPEILDLGDDTRLPGGSWILMGRVPGQQWDTRTLPEPATTVTINDLAEYLSRLHGVRLPGYGWLDNGGRGTSPTWRAWMRSEAAESAKVLVAHDDLPASFPAEVDRVIRAVVPDDVRPALLNADLGLSEIFVDPETGAVTGILDWAAAAIGDPLYDLATFAFGGPAGHPLPPLLQPRLFDAYCAHDPMIAGRPERLVALYQMLNHLANACWSIAEGVDSWTGDLCVEAMRLFDVARE
ncbi:phosphotransferase [Actinopolymorpha sp. B17G11]|uniref:phosphotransferase family protein n=1 Tax=Actinopolymorpha sp. B17G11 TaxID=3160861 RepID=UPI0032E47FC3